MLIGTPCKLANQVSELRSSWHATTTGLHAEKHLQKNLPWYNAAWHFPAVLACWLDLHMQPARCFRRDLNIQLTEAGPIFQRMFLTQLQLGH